MIIRNGSVYDCVRKQVKHGDLVLRDGKIVSVGKAASPLPGEEIFDAKGLRVYPGFVEAHCHLGLCNDSSREQDDNDHSDPVQPQLRGIDSLNPQDPAFRAALRYGVTTVCTGPGSANVVGGTFLAVKTYGNCVDDMIVKNPIAMKCAFGENPKNRYPEKGVTVRMSVAAKLRELLFLSKEYLEEKEAAAAEGGKPPKFNMKYEAMIPVLKREIPLKAHAHRADDICTAIRIAKEFNVRITIEHGTAGVEITDVLLREKVPVAYGPFMGSSKKQETITRSPEVPGILAKAGVPVCIVTDAPVNPISSLPLAAGSAIKEGMDPFAALQAVTINAARHAGIDDRVGSLEPGKDADVLVCDGDPLVNTTKILAVFVDGIRRI